MVTPPTEKAQIAALMARMTLPEKIGQLVQADLCCVTPADVRQYHLGSILVGGNSGPGGNDFALAPQWLKAADDFWAASVDTSQGAVGIPIIWGIDAVHGNSNIIGATLFPHNVGLGAAHDPALIERIGAITATEIRVTGQEWTFAPTVTVPQDYRWGRAYEGYSSDPRLVASYVGAMVRGLQGPPDQRDLLARGKVIASTKHFLADGGTKDGVDQGDADIAETELRDIHGLPYGPAVENGVATVMASFSSWQGVKMAGNRSLLTGVLKDRMDFGGFLVTDWNSHGQVAGCTNDSCPQALEAGVDMYMAPDTWKAIYADLLARARAGTLPIDRIDDAVRRVLDVKSRLGLFGAGKPSSRPLSGRFDLLGAPEHRAVAREAVRKSLVLLKNQGVLPIKAGGRLLIAGEGTDDVARQSGGWTITWQGTGLGNDKFPGATSLYSGFRQAVEAGGGSVELNADGNYTRKPDAAVVVFGEKPYAEFQGDRATLALDSDLTGPYQTMRKLKAQGIPVIAVMLTGRPLYTNPALNLADAFVVAWLPGSEGGGVADVLVGDGKGRPRFDFTGSLAARWPLTPNMREGVLYDMNFGLSYASPAPGPWKPLREVDASQAMDSRTWFTAGRAAASWSLLVEGINGTADETRITTVPAEALGGRVKITALDYRVQEGARRFTVTGGPAAIALRNFSPVNLDRETNADVLLLFTARVFGAPESAALTLVGAKGSGSLPVSLTPGDRFVRYGVALKCLRGRGADVTALTKPFVLSTQGAADIALGEVRLGMDAEVVLPCPA
ncbi:glycoside hydrolase family 3 protein [Novosphingobium sp.]|uniref:glycoside hydrolase family 3 protein n=1 Tax=Novosphingobium sp. TaxID=1874826 RepID=UPI0025E8E26C|nr:glycoside hydrolase family 3 protein [Novosphingobium sp.]